MWAIAAVFAAGITAALFLRDRDTERDHVAAYIEQVNTTQGRFATRYGSVNRTLQDFKLSAAAAEAQLPQLRTAARTLTDLRLSVERVQAPPEARPLRRRMLAFLRQPESVARELVAVALYLPKLRAAEAPLAAASKRLRTRLAAASEPLDQGVAVREYAADLRRVAKSLDAIDAPPLLAPSHAAYIHQLRAYAASSEALQRGIRANDQAAVDAAVARMETAATAPSGSVRAQATAIKAYNARVVRIRTLGVALERERRRLERDL